MMTPATATPMKARAEATGLGIATPMLRERCSIVRRSAWFQCGAQSPLIRLRIVEHIPFLGLANHPNPADQPPTVTLELGALAAKRELGKAIGVASALTGDPGGAR